MKRTPMRARLVFFVVPGDNHDGDPVEEPVLDTMDVRNGYGKIDGKETVRFRLGTSERYCHPVVQRFEEEDMTTLKREVLRQVEEQLDRAFNTFSDTSFCAVCLQGEHATHHDPRLRTASTPRPHEFKAA